LDGQITDTKVAGYLAKYATKATEATGHASSRITGETIDDHIADLGHVARLIAACWDLGRPGCNLEPDQDTRNSGRMSYRRLRRWAHMLGFGGHFSTKSRHYSTTLKALRETRVTWRRQDHRSVEHTDDETTLIIGGLAYDTTGWRTTGDALLANTAAAKAREHRRVAREQIIELNQNSQP
ncbi:MAG: replication initiator, partial [Nocardioidaceae bacterium]